MASFWDNIVQRVRDLWTNTTIAQKILIGGLFVCLIVFLILFLYWMNQPQYAVLYSKLSQKDASRVTEILEQENVSYQLKNNGSTVLVPQGKKDSLRLKVAGQDVLKGKSVGFEIFNKSQIGQTDFVQQVNYQRALQGELSKTIGSLPSVESARVHLVLPEKSLFIEQQNPSSASVLLNLKPGAEMEQDQVESIVSFVTTAVEGLKKDSITVSDASGNMLNQPQKGDSTGGWTDTQLEYKSKLENNLEQQIQMLLAPVIGPSKIKATVNTDLDLSKKTIQKEQYDPDSAVVRSEKVSRESQSGSANMEQGSPGPNYQGEEQGGTGTSQQSSRTQKTTNFEINKEEQQIVIPKGTVERISASVLVDGKYEKGDNGETVFKPRGEQEMQKIRNLVKNAIGFKQARGDSIEVSSMPFSKPQPVPEPTWSEKMLDYLQRFWKPLLNAIIVLIFLIFVVRPIVLSIIRPRVEEEEGRAEGLPESEETRALAGEESEAEVQAKESRKHYDDLQGQAKEIIDNKKDDAMHVIRRWLQEKEE